MFKSKIGLELKNVEIVRRIKEEYDKGKKKNDRKVWLLGLRSAIQGRNLKSVKNRKKSLNFKTNVSKLSHHSF
jgi:hypothetical protein